MRQALSAVNVEKELKPFKKITIHLSIKYNHMPNWLRALIAGYGAKKLGGGCFSTILVFVVLYYALGQCNHPATAPVRQGNLKVERPTRTAMVQPVKNLNAVQLK